LALCGFPFSVATFVPFEGRPNNGWQHREAEVDTSIQARNGKWKIVTSSEKHGKLPPN